MLTLTFNLSPEFSAASDKNKIKNKKSYAIRSRLQSRLEPNIKTAPCKACGTSLAQREDLKSCTAPQSASRLFVSGTAPPKMPLRSTNKKQKHMSMQHTKGHTFQ